MSFERIGGILPKVKLRAKSYSVLELRHLYPPVNELEVEDEDILNAESLILELHEQETICGACQGYDKCGKIGDAKGMWYKLASYQGNLIMETSYCKPFQDHVMIQRASKYSSFSLRNVYDHKLTFANFPYEQRSRRPKLFAAAEQFAETYQVGQDMKGIYVFGPAGVGKTHLLHAIINRLEERRIPSIIISADAMFDRLRSMIGEGRDIDPVLETFSSVPVLAIDEIGQERPNHFTLEKMFRIINQRFTRRLPTLYASNYAPPDLYARMSEEFLPFIDPLKSRIIGMSRVGYLDGDDYRIAHMELLDEEMDNG